VDEACDAVGRVARRVAPDAKNSALLQKSYQTYRRIYPALREIFPASL
jgi:sugar (pentulose or hexulose) kinase